MSEMLAKKTVSRASARDLVYWFLLKDSMSQKKIQKLAYYSQAWSLVFLDADIVDGIKFQAWVHGPVNMDIRMMLMDYRWNFIYLNEPDQAKKDIDGKFTKEQLEILEQVWNVYGEYNADQLERLTHNELPWLEQRKGLEPLEASKNIISNETMKMFYEKMIVE